MGLALAMLIDDHADVDWYVYVNLDSPDDEDRSRVIASVSAHGGSVTGMSLADLARHGHLGMIASGTMDTISMALVSLATESREPIRSAILHALGGPADRHPTRH